jgi:hypothetical protein
MVKSFQSNNIFAIDTKINEFLLSGDYKLIDYKFITTLPNGDLIIMIEYDDNKTINNT